jgi:hypothetical protein
MGSTGFDTGDFANSEIFNHDSDWYKDGAQYFASAVRLTNTNTNTLVPSPYLMIRTAKGVTLEGIDGMDYLKQAAVSQPTTSATTL